MRVTISNLDALYQYPKLVLVLVFSVIALLTGPVYGQVTLSQVKDRGAVACGVSIGLKGFSQPNSLGDFSGLDADFCRAVASAIFNDPTKVEFVPLSTTQRFDALNFAYIDLLARNTTWTMSRNIEFGEFVGINYFDGQGFMVPKRTGIRSALELDNKGVCVIRDTTTALNVEDFFSVGKMRYKPVYVQTNDEIIEAYNDGNCVGITNDRSALAAIRAELARPDAHLVLPEVISKEPLGPVVRTGDPDWANLVRWSLSCMINAEEMGVTSANIGRAANNATPAIQRLLGLEGDFGSRLGVSNTWCANIITHIGNYAESYERNVGVDTALGLERGVNRLWTDGGLLYAPPIR